MIKLMPTFTEFPKIWGVTGFGTTNLSQENIFIIFFVLKICELECVKILYENLIVSVLNLIKGLNRAKCKSCVRIVKVPICYVFLNERFLCCE